MQRTTPDERFWLKGYRDLRRMRSLRRGLHSCVALTDSHPLSQDSAAREGLLEHVVPRITRRGTKRTLGHSSGWNLLEIFEQAYATVVMIVQPLCIVKKWAQAAWLMSRDSENLNVYNDRDGSGRRQVSDRYHKRTL